MSLKSRTVCWSNVLLRRVDVSLQRFSRTTPARRARFMNDEGINVVLDVGAHVGEYAETIRKLGFGGRIESFEPLARPFRELRARSSRDAQWSCHRLAVGRAPGMVALHVAANEVSSSALPMLERHVQGAPSSAIVGNEEVRCTTLDAMAVTTGSDRVLLKIDVQGFEQEVLLGASRTLDAVRLLEIELSLVPLYDGAPTYTAMVEELAKLGYEAVWFTPGFVDTSSGRLLQMDGIFARSA